MPNNFFLIPTYLRYCFEPVTPILSEIITIPKVPGTQDCTKYRTISLISHASKTLLEIVRRRQYYIGPQIAEEQFGFTPGKGTADAILALRLIIEKVIKKQNSDLHILFIDYSKAFDTVYHSFLWKVLTDLGVPQHLVWLIRKLYEKATGIVRVDDDNTEEFEFGKGVRQGCLLSPFLFNAVGESIMRKVENTIEADEAGITIGGRKIWNIRYADDTAIIAKSIESLQNVTDRVERDSAEAGLKINVDKTQLMSITSAEDGAVIINNNTIDQTQTFKYLGSQVNTDSDSSPEIKVRTSMARSNFASLHNVWKWPDLDLTLKKQLAKSLVWSVAAYGCESLAMKERYRGRINALEMWIWRRILGITWHDRVTNEYVRKSIGEKYEDGLLEQIKRRKIAKCYHWKRRGDSLVLCTIEGEVSGKCKRGRRRTSWIDEIREWHGTMEMARNKARRRLRL